VLLQHIIDTIESVAPLKWQEEWDNSGLQVGDRNADIRAALLTTDLTESVVDEAIEQHCDLIISHHPLLFHGLKTVTGATPQQRIVEKAILHHIAIYSSHTAMDVYLNGVSGKMAEKIGLRDYHILSPNPENEKVGLGVVGQSSSPLTFSDLLACIKKAFDAPMLRYIVGPKTMVQTIAICGGAGAELMDAAIEVGADVFISADMKYHEMAEAEEKIGLVDIDHWVSEHFTTEIFQELLQGKVTTYISKEDHSPIKIY